MNTRSTPAYLPAGDVTLFPPNATSCGPMQLDDNPVSAKFPEASEIVDPVQPVVEPPPFRPIIVTVTPASDVSAPLSTTVRPSNDVVIAVTFSVALADSDKGIPSTVAAPATTTVEVLVA